MRLVIRMYYDFPINVFPYAYRSIPLREFKAISLNKAVSEIKGGPLAPDINGTVYFNNVMGGTLVCAQIVGLPTYQPAQNGKSPIGPHGFHIHQDGNCEVVNTEDPFSEAHGHWNPTDQPQG